MAVWRERRGVAPESGRKWRGHLGGKGEVEATSQGLSKHKPRGQGNGRGKHGEWGVRGVCGECRFQVVEVGWNKGSWPRCSVEPTRLKRVFSIGVGIWA